MMTVRFKKVNCILSSSVIHYKQANMANDIYIVPPEHNHLSVDALSHCKCLAADDVITSVALCSHR